MTALLVVLAALAIVTVLGFIIAWLIDVEESREPTTACRTLRRGVSAMTAPLPAARLAEIDRTELVLGYARLVLSGTLADL